jgi:D-sedoheptulose 7-phosphate isomerase
MTEKIDLRIKQFEKLKENRSIFIAVDLMEYALRNGKKMLIFGNGGSSTQASHFAAELVNKFYFERAGIPAISLTDNTANITSIANDRDFKYIFSRQVESIGKEGDVAIGISTSGKSENVLEALAVSQALKLKTVMLCGENIKPFQKSGIDVIIPVNSADTPVIQEMHLFMLHIFAEILEKKLFPVPEP